MGKVGAGVGRPRVLHAPQRSARTPLITLCSTFLRSRLRRRGCSHQMVPHLMEDLQIYTPTPTPTSPSSSVMAQTVSLSVIVFLHFGDFQNDLLGLTASVQTAHDPAPALRLLQSPNHLKSAVTIVCSLSLIFVAIGTPSPPPPAPLSPSTPKPLSPSMVKCFLPPPRKPRPLLFTTQLTAPR